MSPFPVRHVRFGFNDPACRKGCFRFDPTSLVSSGYVGHREVGPEQRLNASLDLDQFEDFDVYVAGCRKVYKGNVVRTTIKAGKLGFHAKPFVKRLFVPDIVAINHSREVRSGGLMRPSYRRSVEEMGGFPRQHVPFSWPRCALHYNLLWGVFQPVEGRQSGDVDVNEQLLGYINLKRIGDVGLYSMILGHGDFLRHGVMYFLHFEIMRWLLTRSAAHAQGLRQLLYSTWVSGGDGSGLQLWKKKTLFEPAYWVADELATDAHPA